MRCQAWTAQCVPSEAVHAATFHASGGPLYAPQAFGPIDPPYWSLNATCGCARLGARALTAPQARSCRDWPAERNEISARPRASAWSLTPVAFRATSSDARASTASETAAMVTAASAHRLAVRERLIAPPLPQESLVRLPRRCARTIARPAVQPPDRKSTRLNS